MKLVELTKIEKKDVIINKIQELAEQFVGIYKVYGILFVR